MIPIDEILRARATITGVAVRTPLLRLDTDSDASIFTSGLLGGQYIGISPGGLDEYLANGDEITFVQDALVLENLIGKFLVNMAGGKEESDAAADSE